MNRPITIAFALVFSSIAVAASGADEPATIRFAGKVLDPDRRPLSDAKVYINNVREAFVEGDLAAYHTRTDDAGRWDIPFRFRPVDPEMTCVLTFEKKGFVVTEKSLTMPPRNGTQSFDMVLSPGLPIAGVLRFPPLPARGIPGQNEPEISSLLMVKGENFERAYFIEKGDAFEIYVPPGEYHIQARSGPRSMDRGGIKAGTTNLVLEPEPFPWTEHSVGLVFDKFWDVMDSHYSYFFLKTNVDWVALKDQYRPRAIQTRNSRELAGVLQQMLAPLRDLHVWIETPDGMVPTYTNGYQFNGNGNVVRESIEEPTLCRFAVVGKSKPDGFGYFLLLRQSQATEELVEQAIAAIQKLSNAPGFIVDLRRANGGNELFAQKIASLFCAQDVVYARQKYRKDSGGHDEFQAESERILKKGSDPYTKPVVCLIGPGAVSSGEAFAKMMKALPQVTTVGMPTRGASGNPKPFRLGDTGLSVTFSRWVDLMPDGQTFEGRGIPPEVKVDEPPSAYADRDPTLEKGLEILRQKIERTQ